MIAQNRNEKERSKVRLVCIFFAYVSIQQMHIYIYMHSLSTGCLKKCERKKVKRKETESIGVYKVSGSFFLQTTILYTIATFQTFFPYSSGDSFSSFSYKLLFFMLIGTQRHIGSHRSRYVYSFSLSLPLFFSFVYAIDLHIIF